MQRKYLIKVNTEQTVKKKKKKLMLRQKPVHKCSE